MRVVPQFRSGAVKSFGAILVMLMLFGTLAVVGIGGAADVEVHNQTVEVNDQTDSLYVEATNHDTTAQANLTADFVAYDSNDTELRSVTAIAVEPGANSTAISQPGMDLTDVSYVEVTATLDNTSVTAENVTVVSGTFEQTEAGGGGFDLGSMSMTEYGVIAVVIVGFLYVNTKDND